MSISAVVDERALREIYLAAFEMVVKEAKPWTLMCSYNRINGVYSSENEWLLNRVLRKEWGFEGFVMTDWGASNYRVLGVGSGCDLEMPSSGERNTQRIIRAVRSGKLHESRLDLCVRRILEASQRYLDGKRSAIFDREQDHEIARELAREAMVLLKMKTMCFRLRKARKSPSLANLQSSRAIRAAVAPISMRIALLPRGRRRRGRRSSPSRPDTFLITKKWMPRCCTRLLKRQRMRMLLSFLSA